MPMYKYRCNKCRHETLIEMSFAEHDISKQAPMLHIVGIIPDGHIGEYEQVIGFVFHRGMSEHYNASTGTYISSVRQGEEVLKQRSDEMSQRMGFETRYEFVDGHETAELGVTEQGLYETEKRHRELGWTESTTKVII